jgi:hypothetical protein
MKVLFVGDGKHDIGKKEYDPTPRLGGGTVGTLALIICPAITESIALAWREISRFNPACKHGYAAKVSAAIVASSKRYGCDGTVCVVDHDRDPSRLPEMKKGQARGLQLVGDDHRVACGVAVESIEAWTLGARKSIAEELGQNEEDIRSIYPSGVHVEHLYENSGKEEHRPRAILKRIAKIGHREPDLEFREAVARRTDVQQLEKECPKGFKPFVDELRVAFGSSV